MKFNRNIDYMIIARDAGWQIWKPCLQAPDELGISDFKMKDTKKRMFKVFTYFKEKNKERFDIFKMQYL